MTEGKGPGQIGAVQAPEPALHVISRDPHPEPSFDRLFLDHYAFVCRILHTMGVDNASVEDVAQDVFVVLHRKLDEYDRERDVRSWLWGIARRVASTHARTTVRAERKLRAIPNPGATEPLDERYEHRQRAEFVSEFLRELPEEQREVFVLTELESMTAPEIAQLLGIKLNTVYSRLRTARSRFKQSIARHKARESRLEG